MRVIHVPSTDGVTLEVQDHGVWPSANNDNTKSTHHGMDDDDDDDTSRAAAATVTTILMAHANGRVGPLADSLVFPPDSKGGSTEVITRGCIRCRHWWVRGASETQHTRRLM